MLYQVICSHVYNSIANAFDERRDIRTDKDVTCEFTDKRSSYVPGVPSALNEEKLCKVRSKNIERKDTMKIKGNKFYL